MQQGITGSNLKLPASASLNICIAISISFSSPVVSLFPMLLAMAEHEKTWTPENFDYLVRKGAGKQRW